MGLYDDSKEEMMPLAGDGAGMAQTLSGDVAHVSQSTRTRDPFGSGQIGASSGVNLDKSKDCTVVIRYKDTLIEADVYAFPDAPLKVVILCPKCGKALNIESDKKQIQLEKHAPQQVGEFVNWGKISIEPYIQCTWEKRDAGQHVPGLVTGGLSLCKWKVGISNNIAKDA